MLEYRYRDKNGEIKEKDFRDISVEGAIYVGIGMIISLVLCLIIKLML
jgi:hypothetical protein